MINAVDTDDAVVVSGRIPSLFPDTFGCACEKTRMEKKEKKVAISTEFLRFSTFCLTWNINFSLKWLKEINGVFEGGKKW